MKTENLQNRKTDDIVWYGMFELTIDREILSKKPARGILKRSNDPEKDRCYAQAGWNDVHFFVPFKENTDEPDWSNAICAQTTFRFFTDTKEECIACYNKRVQAYLDLYEKQIANVKPYLIPVDNQ